MLYEGSSWYKAKVLWFWGDHPLWKGRYEVLGAVGQHTVKAEHIRAIAAALELQRGNPMKKIIVALCLAATPAGALRAQTAATVYMTLLRQQYDAAKSEFLTAQKNAVLAARAGQTETAYMFARQMDYARARMDKINDLAIEQENPRAGH